MNGLEIAAALQEIVNRTSLNRGWKVLQHVISHHLPLKVYLKPAEALHDQTAVSCICAAAYIPEFSSMTAGRSE